MDAVGEEVEEQINSAFSYPFNFHGVNKIVVRLGPSLIETPDYVEILGVGKKQYPNFCASDYKAKSDDERRSELLSVAKAVFEWLDQNFEDAEFVRKAASKLDWDLKC